MIIRELRQNDAVRMYEWMTDTAVTEGLHGDYTNVTVEDARRFIDECPENERHFAIANDEDEYMGTVSLRHIDTVNAVAEFAIVVRSDAMSRGYAWHGMVEALDMAFGQMGLETVYWRVRADNQRAVRFFKKHGFNMADDVPKEFLDRHSNESNLLWFTAWHGDDYRNEALSRGEVAGCRILKIRTIPTIEAGELSFFESCKDIDFDIKRIYYISKVPEGRRRGYHAHKKLKQVLFCPYGRIQLVLENAGVREEITLSDPSIAILIDKPIWREMLWLQKDSVLVVGASDYYDADDYIRDYDEFRRYVGGGC